MYDHSCLTAEGSADILPAEKRLAKEVNQKGGSADHALHAADVQ